MLAVNAPRYVSLSCSHKLYQFITFKLSWPSPTISPTPRFMGFPTSPLRDPFSAPLLSNFYLTSFGSFQFVRFLHLSSVSRNLRELLTEPAFLNQTTKVAVLSGSEFWILLVTTIAGEEERALHVALEWLATASSNRDRHSHIMHACYESGSMGNRQRLWNIVKQFYGVWKRLSSPRMAA